MKVMTNKTEACGPQSRTEIRQTVAQMAAPNFKDSVPEDSPGQVMIFPRANSYFAPCKLGLRSVQTRTLLRAKSRFASGKLLARRAAMLLILMIGMVGSAWGATKVVDKYVKWDQASVQCSIEDVTIQLGKDLSALKDAYYIKWYVANSGGVAQDYGKGAYQQIGKWSIAVKDNVWPYQENTSSKFIYLDNTVNFWNGDDLSTKAEEWGLL